MYDSSIHNRSTSGRVNEWFPSRKNTCGVVLMESVEDKIRTLRSVGRVHSTLERVKIMGWVQNLLNSFQKRY